MLSQERTAEREVGIHSAASTPDVTVPSKAAAQADNSDMCAPAVQLSWQIWRVLWTHRCWRAGLLWVEGGTQRLQGQTCCCRAVGTVLGQHCPAETQLAQTMRESAWTAAQRI